MPSDNYQGQARGESFTPNSVWSSTSAQGSTQQVTTPLGQTCLIRTIDVADLIEAGVLSQTDSLTAVAQKHLKTSGPNTQARVDEAALLRDPAAIKATIGLADKVMPFVVVDPKVVLHYKEVTVGQTTVTKMLTEEEQNEIRKAHSGIVLVFTNQIAFEDKMWLFEKATGGLSKMASFRRESSDAVGSMAAKPRRKNKAKRRSGDN